jgi:hypothetical protein
VSNYNFKEQLNQERGSALLMTIIMTFVMALMIGGYLNVTINGLIISYRSVLNNTALNLGEAGVEEAAWAINNKDWTDWNEIGNIKTRSISNIDLGANKSGDISIIVEDFANDPTIYTEGHSQSVYGGDYNKQIEVKLTRRSFFGNGLLARNTISFVGANVTVDSFNSDNGDYHTFFNRGANVTVGSLSPTANAVNIQNANVFGYVKTGGGEVGVGPQGFVSDLVDPPVHDPSRITRGLRTIIPEVTAPTLSFPHTSLPEGNFKVSGTPGSLFPQEYQFNDLNIGSREYLIINGPVVIVVDGDVNVKGKLIVSNYGNATIYVEDDFTVGGRRGAINNIGVASAFTLYGTNETPGEQNITLGGSSNLRAAVLAPNASLKLNGGGGSGAFFGAALVYDITFTGTYVFHFDEALNNYFGANPKYKMESWSELSGEDKIDFSTYPN